MHPLGVQVLLLQLLCTMANFMAFADNFICLLDHCCCSLFWTPLNHISGNAMNAFVYKQHAKLCNKSVMKFMSQRR